MTRRYLAVLVLLASCTQTTPPARAFQIKSRADLIGGKRALAEVDDFKLSNGVIHAIIQNVGTSRGFGAFGGSLIDIDLVRGNKESPITGTNGNDYFTEMFPAFFLQAIEPEKVEVLQDGSDGKAAIVRVSGRGALFVSLVKSITDIVIPKVQMDYTCDYILEPGKQYLKIVTTVTNPGPDTAQFPLTIPLGFVTLLGEGQQLFVPGGAGFDMRYYLEDVVYKRSAALEALPGVVTPMWTTAGDGVSYALVPGRQPNNDTYLLNKPEYYPDATPDSLLIPIASSSFLGSFWAKSPPEIPVHGSYSYTAYLAVGSGDVASAQRVAYDIYDLRANGKPLRDRTPIGNLSGVVRERLTGQPLQGVSVVLIDDQGNYVSQATTLKNGVWSAPVPPGKYHAAAVDRVRPVARADEPVEVTEGGSGRIDLSMEEPGNLQVVVRDEKGRALPSKLSVEAIAEHTTGALPRNYLYDLKVGERYRQTDMLPDDEADPQTRRYLEKVFFATNGTAGVQIIPGHYKVFASRGIEYDLVSQDVEVKPGETATLGFTLTQVLPTPGWVSGDFHVHSVKSVDSDMELPARVASYAVEGVDFVASTDHNYVVDFAPTVDSLQLNDWLRSSVGLELTSLEMGHFNAFPLLVSPGPVTHGSFRWFMEPPGKLFAQLRGLGKDQQKTIVQVNHPRDSILGYFNAFNVRTYFAKADAATSSVALDTSPVPDGHGGFTTSPYDQSNFSLDFDAFEVFNGKREDIMFSYRIPEQPIPGPEPSLPRCPAGGPIDTDPCLPAPGELLERLVPITVNGVTRNVLQPENPGALDDWFTLLSQGRRITATGNSDSHSDKAEAGLPRTYLEVGDGADHSMRGLDEDKVYDAMREGRAFVTNGPIVAVTVNGKGIGGTVVEPHGDVEVHISVSAAPWIDVKKVTVRRGGKDQVKVPEVLETIPVPATREVKRLDATRTYHGLPDDSFIVVEVRGDEPMWPVFTPHEVPSLQISDAVGVIGGAFGFGDKYGKYKPSLLEQVRPYAFTNPIWVTWTNKQGLTAPKKVLPVSNSEPFVPRTMPDLRRLYGAFHSDLP